MECPECDNRTRVLDSRRYAGAVYRKRECKTCHFRFWTEELEIEEDSQMIREMMAHCKMRYRDRHSS